MPATAIRPRFRRRRMPVVGSKYPAADSDHGGHPIQQLDQGFLQRLVTGVLVVTTVAHEVPEGIITLSEHQRRPRFQP